MTATIFGTPVTRALRDVISERGRQVTEEYFVAAHDDAHTKGELVSAAMNYAAAAKAQVMLAASGGYLASPPLDDIVPFQWPWELEWWKPKDRRRNLVRSAALLIAEIDRLDRLDEAAAMVRP